MFKVHDYIPGMPAHYHGISARRYMILAKRALYAQNYDRNVADRNRHTKPTGGAREWLSRLSHSQISWTKGLNSGKARR